MTTPADYANTSDPVAVANAQIRAAWQRSHERLLTTTYREFRLPFLESEPRYRESRPTFLEGESYTQPLGGPRRTQFVHNTGQFSGRPRSMHVSSTRASSTLDLTEPLGQPNYLLAVEFMDYMRANPTGSVDDFAIFMGLSEAALNRFLGRR